MPGVDVHPARVVSRYMLGRVIVRGLDDIVQFAFMGLLGSVTTGESCCSAPGYRNIGFGGDPLKDMLLSRAYVGIMERKMETTGIIGIILGIVVMASVARHASLFVLAFVAVSRSATLNARP